MENYHATILEVTKNSKINVYPISKLKSSKDIILTPPLLKPFVNLRSIISPFFFDPSSTVPFSR
jgi:hypothetical protein